MHEAQRNELGEAAGLLLDVAKQHKLIDPVGRSFDVPVHQRGCAANAALVGGADHLLPLFGGELVAGEHEAHVVVENFGGGSGQRVEAVVAQHRQIIRQRHAGEFDAVHDLHGREGVNVHVGHGCFDRAQDVAVVERRQSVRQPALDADFGRAQRPGFDGFLRHGLEAVEVAVFFARAAAEGAELAADKTDVGEIDIAIDHVGDEIADKIAAQHVGRHQQAKKVVAFGIRQQQALFAGEDAAILRRHDLIERVARFPTTCARQRPAIRGRESLPVRNRVGLGSRLLL